MSSVLSGLLVCSVLAAPPTAPAKHDPAEVEFFESRVRPVLASHCYECHGDDEQEAGLQLTSVAAMLRGGDQGPAIVPGNAEASLLVKAIRYDDTDLQMPPKAKLSNAQIAAIVDWIQRGAVGPDESKTSASGGKKKFDLTERAKHWCFQPLAAAAPPAVKHEAWCRGPIDRFVLAKLEEAQLPPTAEAAAHTLCRRLYFDLTGLPPTPEQVEEFVRAYSITPSLPHSAEKVTASGSDRVMETEKAYTALVDRLLASPHFGERWGRHWLDLVRYAETRGHEFDFEIPNAWQYRDYVVRALNADVPYDRFVVEHLAGDLMPNPRRNPATGANESILGTGFWFLGEECHSPVDIRQDETDRVDNKIDVMSKTFLGLTLACARCHDHKFDALSTKDYYALSGFVLSMSFRQGAFEVEEHNRRIYDQARRLEAAARPALVQAQRRLWDPTLAEAEKYLLAVRAALLDLKREGKQANRGAIVTTTAKQFAIDGTRLAAWLEQAEAAEKDETDPLGDWVRYVFRGAKALQSTKPSKPTTINTTDAAHLTTLAKPEPRRPAGPVSAWFQDGFVFRQVDAAQPLPRVGVNAARPLEGLDLGEAWVYEPKWDVLRPRVPAHDGNRINWLQTGRTLKSPTFTLESGRLWYLVRGSGHVYAEVASHRANRGPLHGQLAKTVSGSDQLRWVDHNLQAYAGRRVHLEFSPLEAERTKEKTSTEFAVLDVVESNEPPPLPWTNTAADRYGTIPDADLQSPELTAAHLARHFRAAAERLTAGKANDRVAAATTDWMLKHPALWNAAASATAPEVETFFRQQAALLAELKTTSSMAPVAFEGSGVDEHVLVRGNHGTPGELVPRRFLEVIDGPAPPHYTSQAGRLELAERLVDRRDPLPARVLANRVWYHLMGRGLVRTVDNFGVLGDVPTHPELLDHLAHELMQDGWSMKGLIRRVVQSAAYRQGSQMGPRAVEERDPENLLLHRANVKRLEAEAIRDALLVTAGRFDATIGGPSVPIYLTPFMGGRGRPGASGPLDGQGRRSIYLGVRRNFLNPMFLAFDYPTPFTTIGRRTASNVPAQALSLLNGPLVSEMAAKWAERAAKEVSTDDEARIDRLYREAFSRPPTSDETAAAREFLREQQTLYGTDRGAAQRSWTDLCHVLFNVKEFIFLP
jgi:mono/diheme cytochrome c family protein